MAGEPFLQLLAARIAALAVCGLFCRLLVLRLRQTKNYLSIDRKRLKHDVVAVSVLMHEGGADREPKVVLTFSLVNCVGSVGSAVGQPYQLLWSLRVNTRRRA